MLQSYLHAIKLCKLCEAARLLPKERWLMHFKFFVSHEEWTLSLGIWEGDLRINILKVFIFT